MRIGHEVTSTILFGLFASACGPTSSGGDDGGTRGTGAEARGSSDVEPKSCGEPTSCPGIDRSRAPEITCISPDAVVKSAAFTLHIFGRYVQDVGGAKTKISFDGASVAGGNVLAGAPVSPCHVTVDVPAGFLAGAGPVKVYAVTAFQSEAFELAVK